ncbi:MAG TPA: hypothetical protein VFV79_03025 [Saprospiraceae bacterium]|nr:hypothetical protein [Saprospiraceae bacterium]
MTKFLPLLILLSSLIGYLEWGGGNSGYLFSLEYDLIRKGMSSSELMHPFILLPLVGQIVLLISMFYPKRALVITGILLLSVIMLMILLVGFLSMNVKIIFSAIPFLVLSVYYIISSRKDAMVRLRSPTGN